MTITATWTHGTGQTDANDPAPPSVEIIETAGAQGYGNDGNGNFQAGSVSDGLGDPVIQGVSSTPTTGPPPPHLSQQSGPSFKLTRTFSATGNTTATIPVGSSMFFLWPLAQAYLNSYTISIHAQPYGWYDAGWSANGTDPDTTSGPHSANGSLGFRYKWRSTDGVLADLNGISIYEYVNYSGNPGRFTNYSSGPNYYYPTNPPIGDVAIQGGGTIGFHVQNPEISTAPSTSGFTYDIHSAWPTKAPLSKFTCVAPQQYKFDDPATAQVGIVLYAPGSITDAVQLNPNQFYVGKGTGSAITPL